MNIKTKILLSVPIVTSVMAMIGPNPMTANRDPGFECKNGGLVVVAVENQSTRAIAEKYCTGDIDKANDALIERYRGTTIPHWAFIKVETLGR